MYSVPQWDPFQGLIRVVWGYIGRYRVSSLLGVGLPFKCHNEGYGTLRYVRASLTLEYVCPIHLKYPEP